MSGRSGTGTSGCSAPSRRICSTTAPTTAVSIRAGPCGSARWIATPPRGVDRSITWPGTKVHRLFGGLTIPNGISFSPDGATGYFVDTDVGVLHRVPLDPRTGLPRGPVAIHFDHRGGEGAIDGAAVDAEGLIWTARFGAGCLDAYSPAGERGPHRLGADAATDLPDLRGPRPRPPAGHVRLRGHGRGGPRRGSGARPDHPDRRGRAGAAGAGLPALRLTQRIRPEPVPRAPSAWASEPDPQEIP